MIYFADYLRLQEEVEEKDTDNPVVNIDKFLGKIMSVMTMNGLNELERYYKSRLKQVSISDSDDIQIRDAIDGRRETFKQEEDGEEVQDF